MQGGVIENAFVARVARLIEAAQRVEAENVARIDGVRIGEPGLDCGDAQAAGARGRAEAGAAGGWRARLFRACDARLPIEPGAVRLQRIPACPLRTPAP